MSDILVLAAILVAIAVVAAWWVAVELDRRDDPWQVEPRTDAEWDATTPNRWEATDAD